MLCFSVVLYADNSRLVYLPGLCSVLYPLDPWDHPDFCLDKYRRWIISLNSRTFRDKVIARRLLADNLIIRRFIELERRDGSDVHNEQLLQHMQGCGRASFIIFLDIITDMNPIFAFKRTEFEALLDRP